MKHLSIAFALLASLPAGFLVACDEADEAFDCAQICSKAEDCFGEDYDEEGCVDMCRENAEESDDYSDRADACENCLDDNNDSCADAAWACTDDCAGILIGI